MAPGARRLEIKRRELDLACNAAEEWRLQKPEVEETKRLIRLGGPRAADTPKRVRAFVMRESLRAVMPSPQTVGFEARFGPTLNFERQPPDQLADQAGNPVARLVDLGAAPGQQAGFATAFMISPRLLLTNYHVFPTRQDAESAGAQFDYEEDARGRTRAGHIFELEPRTFFVSNRTLDLALVAVQARNDEGRSLCEFGALRLIPTIGKILKGHPVMLIGYPDGQPKTYVSKDNPLVDFDGLHLRYLSDTDPGASGSPAFNAFWELIALHHRSVPDVNEDGSIKRVGGGTWTRDMPVDQIVWVANEATRVSAIAKHLATINMPSAAEKQLLEEVLAKANDPLGQEIRESPSDVAVRLNTVSDNNSGLPPAPVNIIVNGTANFYTQVPPATGGAAADMASTQGPAPAAPGLEAIIRFDPNYDDREGYDPDFLGEETPVPPPRTAAKRMKEVIQNGKGTELVLDYHHYSLAMNRGRRLMMWSAVNVDYSEDSRKWFKTRDAFGTDKWIPDPRIPNELQLMDADAYKPSPSLQRGHIVRRDDSAWGTSKRNQEYANSDTFHWTNCTPQHGGFNESSYIDPEKGYYAGIWGGLENKIAALAHENGERMCIFGGPVLDNKNDEEYDWGMGGVQIPMKFWKVVTLREKDALASYGFVLDQTKAFEDLGFERLNFGRFKTYQKSLAEIAELAGVEFEKMLLDADVLASSAGFEIRGAGIRRAPPK